jgi:hypothetical protein
MSVVGRSRLRRALQHASHSGFPWVMGGMRNRDAQMNSGIAHSPALRRALRRSVVGHWPPGFRLVGVVLMTLLWPLESLRDAVVQTWHADSAALGGRSRVVVALRAWAAALGWNLPPVDYLSYHLFEPGRPGPGCWLHSADAHLHFSRLAAPEVRALAEDKLVFADLGELIGVGVMPILAVFGADGPIRPFANGAPPPQDLLVKPRRGHGGREHMIWHWEGGRHVAAEPVREPDIEAWLTNAARSSDLLVQALAKPPDLFGPLVPTCAPDVSIITAEWPNGQRAVAFAQMMMMMDEGGEKVGIDREIELATGKVLPALPDTIMPIWEGKPDRIDCDALVIPDWPDILAATDQFHAALPGPAPVLKWDFLLTDQGPKLLETNTGTGIYPLQSMTQRPITETPLGAALEAWAR